MQGGKKLFVNLITNECVKGVENMAWTGKQRENAPEERVCVRKETTIIAHSFLPDPDNIKFLERQERGRG